jgi:hypothetical protein
LQWPPSDLDLDDALGISGDDNQLFDDAMEFDETNET